METINKTVGKATSNVTLTKRTDELIVKNNQLKKSIVDLEGSSAAQQYHHQ